MYSLRVQIEILKVVIDCACVIEIVFLVCLWINCFESMYPAEGILRCMEYQIVASSTGKGWEKIVMLD
jgi:hypothetical protein